MGINLGDTGLGCMRFELNIDHLTLAFVSFRSSIAISFYKFVIDSFIFLSSLTKFTVVFANITPLTLLEACVNTEAKFTYLPNFIAKDVVWTI